MSTYEPMKPRGQQAERREKPQSKSKSSRKSNQPSLDIISLMEKPNLFGPWFDPPESWFPWKVFLAAGFGLPIERTGDPTEAMKIYQECTRRTKWPDKQAQTLAMVCGMRAGKLLALDTPILTPNGYASISELTVGDVVFDENGLPTKILEIHDAIPDEAYAMRFSDGTIIKAGGDHEWVTWQYRDRRNYTRRGFLESLGPVPENWPTWAAETYHKQIPALGPEIRTTATIAKTIRIKAQANHSIPLTKSIEFPEADLAIDPYLLGLWLGNGSSAGAEMTAGVKDIAFIRDQFEQQGYPTKLYSGTKAKETRFGVSNNFRVKLRALALLNNKHVPVTYLHSSVSQRTALLQGLMDSDGYADPRKQCVEFCNTNKKLAEAVLWLARSLGQKVKLAEGVASLNGRVIGPKYRVTFSPTIDVFRIPRKLNNAKKRLRCELSRRHTFIQGCTLIPNEPMRCLVVDSPNSMYLCSEALIPTHNSRIASLIAMYLCCLRDYSKYLSPGERGYLPVIAADRKQARVVFSYANAYVTEADIFKALLEGEPLKERISFSNNVDLEIMTASSKSTKGYTNVGGVLDEIAFFSSEDSANPDFEIVASVRRGMRTIPNSTLVMLSSPYARRGVLWDTYRDHFGKDDDPVFVWQAPTWVMNRTLSKAALQDDFDRDPDKANADYGAEFRKDVARFAPLQVIEACVDKDRVEFGPRTDTYYFGFVDPSGGSQDSMTLAIGHLEEMPGNNNEPEQHVIVDAIYEEIPPFSPDSVAATFAQYLKNYGILQVTGDRYAGEWPAERFSAHGITYEASKKVTSDLYRDLLPLLNSRRVALPDNTRLIHQLWNLERTTSKAGRDSIGHPKGGHDDIANAVAGLASHLAAGGPISLVW